MTNKPLYTTLIILLSTSFTVISQETEFLVINGEIVDPDLNPIEFVNVISLKSGKGTISSSNGQFTFRALKNDTILFSAIGYQSKKIPVSQIMREQNYIVLQEMIYQIDQVDVMEMRWQDFNRQIIDMKLTPLEKHILEIEGLPDPYMKLVQIKPNMVSNPITAIYELLKKENVRKRKQARWNRTYNKTWIKSK